MKRDPSWVKARIGARILIRQHLGRITARDARWAHRIAHDVGVTDRLLDPALASLCARATASNDHDVLRATLAPQP